MECFYDRMIMVTHKHITINDKTLFLLDILDQGLRRGRRVRDRCGVKNRLSLHEKLLMRVCKQPLRVQEEIIGGVYGVFHSRSARFAPARKEGYEERHALSRGRKGFSCAAPVGLVRKGCGEFRDPATTTMSQLVGYGCKEAAKCRSRQARCCFGYQYLLQ